MIKHSITNLRGTSDLQQDIMILVDEWARTEKTPITRKYLLKSMIEKGQKKDTVITAVKVLCTKGFIRPAVTTSNSTSYVQLRGCP